MPFMANLKRSLSPRLFGGYSTCTSFVYIDNRSRACRKCVQYGKHRIQARVTRLTIVVVTGSSRVSTPVYLRTSTSKTKRTVPMKWHIPRLHLHTAYCPSVRGLSPTRGAIDRCAYVPGQVRTPGPGRRCKLLWSTRLALVHRIRRERTWGQSRVRKPRDVLLVEVIVVYASTPQLSTSRDVALCGL